MKWDCSNYLTKNVLLWKWCALETNILKCRYGNVTRKKSLSVFFFIPVKKKNSSMPDIDTRCGFLPIEFSRFSLSITYAKPGITMKSKWCLWFHIAFECIKYLLIWKKQTESIFSTKFSLNFSLFIKIIVWILKMKLYNF